MFDSGALCYVCFLFLSNKNFIFYFITSGQVCQSDVYSSFLIKKYDENQKNDNMRDHEDVGEDKNMSHEKLTSITSSLKIEENPTINSHDTSSRRKWINPVYLEDYLLPHIK